MLTFIVTNLKAIFGFTVGLFGVFFISENRRLKEEQKALLKQLDIQNKIDDVKAKNIHITPDNVIEFMHKDKF